MRKFCEYQAKSGLFVAVRESINTGRKNTSHTLATDASAVEVAKNATDQDHVGLENQKNWRTLRLCAR